MRSAGGRVAGILPALLPGLCVVLLAFQAGGFFPDSWSALAAAFAVALALRVTTVDRPFAGISGWTAVAIGALALLGAWTLLSAAWSDAPGRALVEFGRLLAYLLILVLCASLAPREQRLSWAIRGVALAILAVCVAALITRLRPDVWSEPGLVADRLAYPVTSWNALGVLAGIGVVLGLHLSASDREPALVRVLAAALPPVAACTVYFTLSRGGIAATVIGVALYVALGFSRATPGALLAIVPACVVALTNAYDRDLLVSVDYASAAGVEQGRDVALIVAGAAGAAVVLRALALLIDAALVRVPGPERLPRAARIGIPAVIALAAAVVAVALGAPGFVERQADRFFSTAPVAEGSDVRERLRVFNNNGRVEHWNVALDAWREAPVRGTGAGTFQNYWNRDRPNFFQVLDAHSLYVETLGWRSRRSRSGARRSSSPRRSPRSRPATARARSTPRSPRSTPCARAPSRGS